MIGVSLTDSGVQLLGQRRGLNAYVADGKTMGIPILYPWANRLGTNTYTAEGATVTLTAGRDGVRTDPNGRRIHGVLAGYPRWRVTAESTNELTAEVDFGADPDLLASFPFPHLLALTVRLSGRAHWFSAATRICSCRVCRVTSESSRPRRCDGCTSTGRAYPPARRHRNGPRMNRWATRLLTTAMTRSPMAPCSCCLA